MSIALHRGTVWQRIKYALLPKYRRQVDDELRATIRMLVDNPDIPVSINGRAVCVKTPNDWASFRF